MNNSFLIGFFCFRSKCKAFICTIQFGLPINCLKNRKFPGVDVGVVKLSYLKFDDILLYGLNFSSKILVGIPIYKKLC